MSDQTATVRPPESQPQPASSSTSVSDTGNAASSQTTTANQPARSQTSGPYQTATVSVGPVRSDMPTSTAPAAPEGEERSQTSGGGDRSENVPETQLVTNDQKPHDMAVTQVRINTFEGSPLNTSHPKEEMAEAGFYYTDAEQPPEQSPESLEQPERMRMSSLKVKGHLQSFPAQRDDEGRIAELAEAGFYYVDQEKAVKCFCCGGRLENWISEYDPWIEHSRLFPECKFVIQKRGQPSVDAVQKICKPSENLEEQHWTHAAEATPISSDADISVSPASQVQATYSWSEGQVIAQETEGHAGSSSTARPAYSVSTEEPAKDRSAAGYVNGEGRPWMLTLSQPVEEQHDNQQLGEEELSDDDSQVDQAEDDGGIADISLIEGRLCLHCKRWEREVWLTCGHWFLCGSCFFCPQFWRWHLDDHHVPICLVCQEPFEDVEIPRQVVIYSRNRRRTGRCSCYQRKG
ncbi:putative inhibitor of apoptosis [Littorina saxatilis]|uniref:putative inhibitor of apoptosis n=1 Tax=Littorina saxatilis TaxID=31220 RepID=UPI0038B4570A